MCNCKKLMDSPECDILFDHYPDAFILMTIIAKKAMPDNKTALMGLSKGQTFIGDYKKFGLTESRYRKAKKQLEKFGFVSFRPTNRGTIATINDARIYDINSEPVNEQITNIPHPEKLPEESKKQDIPNKPVPDYIKIREKIKNSAPELNIMFREKVIDPLKNEINPAFWETFISPLAVKSVEDGIAYIYHGKDNSWVNNHYRDKIEKKLGMAVRLVSEDG